MVLNIMVQPREYAATAITREAYLARISRWVSLLSHASSVGRLEPTTRPTDEQGLLCQAVSMQSKEILSNRRDAMAAEAGHSQSPENLSLKGGWFGRPLPRSALRKLRLFSSCEGFCGRTATRSVWSAWSLLPLSNRPTPCDSASKLDALQTLRAIRLRLGRAAVTAPRRFLCPRSDRTDAAKHSHSS
jgi:hypothetical protein